jgi:hypothetical protein
MQNRAAVLPSWREPKESLIFLLRIRNPQARHGYHEDSDFVSPTSSAKFPEFSSI